MMQHISFTKHILYKYIVEWECTEHSTSKSHYKYSTLKVYILLLLLSVFRAFSRSRTCKLLPAQHPEYVNAVLPSSEPTVETLKIISLDNLT